MLMLLTGLLVVVVVLMLGLAVDTCPVATLTPNGLNTSGSEVAPTLRASFV